MDSLKQRFEKALKTKLLYKTSGHMTEEVLLLKNFKYFDEEETNNCNIETFLKVIAKVGVLSLTEEELIQIFNVNATSYKKLETPVINFVVGSYNAEVEAPKIEPKVELQPEPKLVPQTSSGFTTYWLLAVVTILVAGAIAFAAFLVK